MQRPILFSILLALSLSLSSPLELQAQHKTWIKAIDNRNLSKVKKLIDKGKFLDSRSDNGRTLLMYAALRGRTKIIKLLIDASADMNVTNLEGTTALIIASIKGHSEVVEVLANAGASLNSQNNLGRTALICATIYEHKKAAKILIHQGANLTKKDNDGHTALFYAKRKRLKNLIKHLAGHHEPDIPTPPSPPSPPVNEADQTPAYRGSGDPLKGLNVANQELTIGAGKYYALIIGIDQYKGVWTPLKNAVNDAKAVEEILRKKYRMDEITSLYNESATGENIIKALESLVEKVKDADNVFIFYSGHGEFKKELNKGFWVPVDAESSSTFKYISNSDIQTFLGAIKSKHTLLIADACFSGDIFRGNTISVPFEESERYFQKVNKLESRQAMTSGGVEPVMDGGKDGHSVFTYYLLKALANNESKYFDAGQLFGELKIPVTNNSDQAPNLQPVKNTGDAGGQFIFIQK
ncbi:MAG: ankyrin repeat domain-containing protein [Flavobacteriales bacterium]|nr:ankyrin repeat domain-containing protein [Flavobacteriales bacterium]